MKRTLKKILLSTALVTLISISVLVVLVLNPQLLFAEKIAYRNFNIYSNYVLPDNYRAIIDYALEQVEKSEIYDPKPRLDIFLCDKTAYNIIDNKILGYAIARSIDNNILLKVKADFANNLLVGPEVKRNLKKTIAHEAMHFYQMRKYGILKFNPINHPPLWKLEGYPEYIAYQEDLNSPSYSLVESIKRLKMSEKAGEYWYATEVGQYDPLIYFKGRVMIEYLKTFKKLSYTEILDDHVSEESVMTEMTSWYQKQVTYR